MQQGPHESQTDYINRLTEHTDELDALITKATKALDYFVNPERSMDCMFICSKVIGILRSGTPTSDEHPRHA